MSMPKLPIGERIRSGRERAGRTQAAVAGLCGITVDYLSQIERGMKVPSLEVLLAIAKELGVPAAGLIADIPRSQPYSSDHGAAPPVVRALFASQPRSCAGASALSPSLLRHRVEDAWRSWQTSGRRFSEAVEVLPELITDTECAVRAHRNDPDAAGRREVLRCAADLYGLLRSYCRRTGRLDLSLMVADRGLRAAEDADDPIRIATAQWNMGHVLLGDGHPESAEDVAMRAISQLGEAPEDHDVIAIVGALHLVAVTSAARRHAWWVARDRLREKASVFAARSGERNVMHTVFGPTNVELHRLSVEMEAGEATEALRIADGIDTTRLPSRERRFTFHLEVARCYDLRGDDAAVLVHLRDLVELAPEDASHSLETRELVRRLLRRARPTYRKQVVSLADRLGIA